MQKQHVTDPQTCIQCSACELACPLGAIENILGRFCVDATRCEGCRKCVRDCPTGAADCFIDVETFFSKEQQASWTELPKCSVV